MSRRLALIAGGLLLAGAALVVTSRRDRRAAAIARASPPPSRDHLPPGAAPRPAALATRLARAMSERRDASAPRTEHVDTHGTAKFVNRLILETSPYLLQHAHNPVDWFPWGEEAFARAREEKKLIFLSVGYSTCHWCHVMERESFEDIEIAREMNEHFVSIKVDREQRPDVDDVYMHAVQMMTGSGGWPMTVVLTPDRKPVFAATYLPPRAGARGRRGLLEVLGELRGAHASEPEKLTREAARLAQRLTAFDRLAPGQSAPIGANLLLRASTELSGRFDAARGGFGRAPKFPRPATLDMLLRLHRRTRDARALEMVTVTLTRMAEGGIHDQLGGGFHRYATDADWRVPHFEKMLYDNAQLALAYVAAHQLTGRDDFADVAKRTLAYVAREMTAPSGAFFTATDADSRSPSGKDVEGYFFTWTPAELDALLPADEARAAAALWGVTARGDIDGRSVLHLTPGARHPHDGGTSASASPHDAVIDRIRGKLLAARSKRAPPLRDDKILTSSNGLMISAFARASTALADPSLLSRGERAARFILDHPTATGALRRHASSETVTGYLADYAFMTQAALDLFEASGDAKWLVRAKGLQATVDADYADARGGYFMTSDKHEALLVRPKPTYDGAEPSGNSIVILNLLRLSWITGDDAYRARALSALESFGPELEASPEGYPMMLAALEAAIDEAREIVVVVPDGRDPAPLLREIRRLYLPNHALTIARERTRAALAGLVAGIADKRALRGEPTAYVCVRGRCDLPTTDPQTLTAQLTRVKPLAPR